MAGLWESWRNPADGERLESCTIVTTAPTSSIAQIHDRMPVILPVSAHAAWLDPANEDLARLDPLLAPYAADLLTSHPVSRRVNSARNDEPELVNESLD